MKIIQICAAYKPAYIYGGPTMSVSKLSEELVKAGEDVIVLATTANGKAELDVPTGIEQIVDGVKVFYFKRLTKDHTHFSPALFSFLRKLIIAEKKAGRKNELIIHIHAWWNLVSIFSCLIAKMYGIKVVLSPRGMLNTYTLSHKNSLSKRFIHQLLGKYLLKEIAYHATSKQEHNDIFAFTNKSPETIPNFIQLPIQHAVETQANEQYQLLFLGRINEIKGLENLFLALSSLTIHWCLTIAGEGDLNYVNHLKQLATQKNIAEKIKWEGYVNNTQKFDLLASVDALVLPSYKENFANVIIEALAVGTSVIVSKEAGVAEYVKETNLGWITSNNPEQLAATIFQSFKDVQKRTQIRASAPTIIKQDFDETALSNKYINMYQNLLKINP